MLPVILFAADARPSAVADNSIWRQSYGQLYVLWFTAARTPIAPQECVRHSHLLIKIYDRDNPRHVHGNDDGNDDDDGGGGKRWEHSGVTVIQVVAN